MYFVTHNVIFFIVTDKFGNAEEDKVSVLSDIESVVTRFCRLTGYNYEKHLVLLLEPLIALRLPKSKLFSLFSSIQKSYIPK